MNVGQLIQKVLDLVKAAKAGNYVVALSLGFEIIKAITDSMPSVMSQPCVMRSGELEPMLNELESLCGETPSMEGPFINLLVPLIGGVVQALIKKWLGL